MTPNDHTPTRLWRRDNTVLIAYLIIVIGILTRIVIYLLIGPQPAEGDSLYYLAVSKNIIEHGVHSDTADGAMPTFYRVPLYPVFLAGLYHVSEALGLSGSYRAVITLVQSALGIGLALCVLWLTRNRATGAIAGLLIVTLPGLIFYEHRVLAEPLAVFLVVLGMLLWHRSTDIRFGAVLAGLCFGLAILTTQIFMLLPILLILFSLIFQRALAARSLIITLVAALCIIPWMGRNATLADGGVFLSKGIFGLSLWVGTWEQDGKWVEQGFPSYAFRSPDERARLLNLREQLGYNSDAHFGEVAVDRIMGDPVGTVSVWLKRLPFVWIGTRSELVTFKATRDSKVWMLLKIVLWGYNSLFLLVGLLGFVMLTLGRDPTALLVVLVLYITAIYTPFHNLETRYSTVGLPILAIFASAFLLRVIPLNILTNLLRLKSD
jgi:4-amino-4-deoxy-L-arabinose transferase-like glycosyltransferase